MVAQSKYYPHYTWDDYQHWEGAWEIIEGIPYAMSPAPTVRHQSISQRIALHLGNQLKNCKTCQALLPIDWRISDDTVVQPDNLVVCGDIGDTYLAFAPSLIFEVLSPSTAQKDQTLKFELYQREGVKYYVMVDPVSQVAKVFALAEDGRYIKKSDARQNRFLFELTDDCQFEFDFSEIWPS
jgi:Uma2 family endonuclease